MKTIRHIVHKVEQPPARMPFNSEILVLFQSNLESMRDWYRKQEGQGQELGHFVMMEISLGNVILALSDALEGTTWLPPK